MNNSFENILKIPGLDEVNTKQKSLKKTPDGKRRRSELEKILAKNEHYKKPKEDIEATITKPSDAFLQTSSSEEIETPNTGMI